MDSRVDVAKFRRIKDSIQLVTKQYVINVTLATSNFTQQSGWYVRVSAGQADIDTLRRRLPERIEGIYIDYRLSGTVGRQLARDPNAEAVTANKPETPGWTQAVCVLGYELPMVVIGTCKNLFPVQHPVIATRSLCVPDYMELPHNRLAQAPEPQPVLTESHYKQLLGKDRPVGGALGKLNEVLERWEREDEERNLKRKAEMAQMDANMPAERGSTAEKSPVVQGVEQPVSDNKEPNFVPAGRDPAVNAAAFPDVREAAARAFGLKPQEERSQPAADDLYSRLAQKHGVPRQEVKNVCFFATYQPEFAKLLPEEREAKLDEIVANYKAGRAAGRPPVLTRGHAQAQAQSLDAAYERWILPDQQAYWIDNPETGRQFNEELSEEDACLLADAYVELRRSMESPAAKVEIKSDTSPGLCPKCGRVFAIGEDFKNGTLEGKCPVQYASRDPDAQKDCDRVAKLRPDLLAKEIREQWVSTSIEALREFYPELSEPQVVAGIHQRVKIEPTGNEQLDYETVRNQVEKLVQQWVTDRRFLD